MPIMQKLSDAYLENGRIDQETERQLYDEALDQMLVIDREFYDQYKDLKDWIKTVPMSIRKQDQADIADFADFKKMAFGTVKIVKDGTPVDTAYRELREMAPELFPEKITHQADQLQRIYDVANSIAISKETLDEAYGKNAGMRNAIADSNLEEEHKLELYRKKISDSKEDEISQFRAAGMDLDTFIEVQNEYSRIKETGKKAGQQAQDFSYWMEKQNLTDRQKKTAKECFTFYSMVPADAKYFNQAVEAGVDADKAYEVVNKITALKPQAGSNYVSDAQKLRVIVDSGLSEKDMVKMIQSTSISTTMKTRLPILLDNGVSIKKQLQFWEKIFDFDADGSGKLNQREVRACLDSFTGGNNNPLEALLGITSSSGPAWTTAEKAAMWQSYNTQFSARKNPYNRKVGEKVKADIKAAGKKDAEPEKTQTAQVSTGMSAWSTGNAELDRALGLR